MDSCPSDNSKCTVCGEIINFSDQILLDSTAYHENCAECSVCGMRINSGNYGTRTIKSNEQASESTQDLLQIYCNLHYCNYKTSRDFPPSINEPISRQQIEVQINESEVKNLAESSRGSVYAMSNSNLNCSSSNRNFSKDMSPLDLEKEKEIFLVRSSSVKASATPNPSRNESKIPEHSDAILSAYTPPFSLGSNMNANQQSSVSGNQSDTNYHEALTDIGSRRTTFKSKPVVPMKPLSMNRNARQSACGSGIDYLSSHVENQTKKASSIFSKPPYSDLKAISDAPSVDKPVPKSSTYDSSFHSKESKFIQEEGYSVAAGDSSKVPLHLNETRHGSGNFKARSGSAQQSHRETENLMAFLGELDKMADTPKDFIPNSKLKKNTSTTVRRESEGILTMIGALNRLAEHKQSNTATSTTPKSGRFVLNLRRKLDSTPASTPSLVVPVQEPEISIPGPNLAWNQNATAAPLIMTSAKSISEQSIEDDRKETGLQRSKNVNIKKNRPGRRIGSSSSNSLAILNTDSLRDMNLSSMKNYEKLWLLYRLLNTLKSIGDEALSYFEASLSPYLATTGGPKDDPVFDMGVVFARDLSNHFVAFNTLLDESSQGSNFKICKSELDSFVKMSGPYSVVKPFDAAKVLSRVRKLCKALTVLSLVDIVDFSRDSRMMPILFVPGWKIEAINLDHVPFYPHINYLSAESNFEKPCNQKDVERGLLNFDADMEDMDAFRRGNKVLRLSNDRPRHELLNYIKPQYIATLSVRDVAATKTLSQCGKIENDSRGEQIIPMDHLNIDCLAYRKHFYLQDHRNYIGAIDKLGDLVVSMKREVIVDDQKASEFQMVEYAFRVLVRAKSMPSYTAHYYVPESDLPQSTVRNLFSKESVTTSTDAPERMWRTAASFIHPKLDLFKLRRVDVTSELRQCETSQTNCGNSAKQPMKIEKSLLQLDEHRFAFNYKFGLLYVKDGQKNETEWFNNTETSDSFIRFCQILGSTISLKGHTGFTGGLDTKNGNTGEKSIYTCWSYDLRSQCALNEFREMSVNSNNVDKITFEIMYHVSTMLPYSPGDEQQIQRKRHIGNDLVTIVFVDKDQNSNALVNPESIQSLFSSLSMFDPRMIRSQFLHVYIIVQEVYWDFDRTPGLRMSETGNLSPGYRVMSTTMNEVPNYSPSLSDPPIFPIGTEEEKKLFRDFILAKIINAENAAFCAPRFKSLYTRTSTGLIETLVKEFKTEFSSESFKPDGWKTLKGAMRKGQKMTTTDMATGLPQSDASDGESIKPTFAETNNSGLSTARPSISSAVNEFFLNLPKSSTRSHSDLNTLPDDGNASAAELPRESDNIDVERIIRSCNQTSNCQPTMKTAACKDAVVHRNRSSQLSLACDEVVEESDQDFMSVLSSVSQSNMDDSLRVASGKMVAHTHEPTWYKTANV